MRKIKLFAFLALLILLSPLNSSALELYSIIQGNCQNRTGLIINVDEKGIYLLSTDGELVRLERTGVEHILVFNTLDNPIQKISLTSELNTYIRNVKVQGEVDNDFLGWPIRFLEDLIVFYDIKGNIHLVNVDMIKGFSIPEIQDGETLETEQNRAYQFGFGNNLPECDQNRPDQEVVQPTRMISDPITISKFLRVYEEGFNKLNRFQKRTSFYARPYLFEKRTKVGIVVDREDYVEELPALLPLNFQWPTGSNYGPQGVLNLGSNVNENLPTVEPVFAVSFEGKYHFLSVMFSGNVWGFSYGKPYIIENRTMFKDFFSRRDPDDIMLLTQYNQVAMTGLEWGPYSFSAGYYYPLTGIQGNNIFREILSEESMPIISLKYTTEKAKVQLIASDINISSKNPSDENIRLIKSEELSQAAAMTQTSKSLIDDMDEFNMHSLYARLNYDYNLSKDIVLGLSEVVVQGVYEETIDDEDYTLKYQQYITSLRLQQVFGEYVSLKGYLNYFMRGFQSETLNQDKDINENKFSFTVVVEFIL